MIVRYLGEAEQEVASALAHYTAKSLLVGAKFMAEFDSVIRGIVEYPSAWPRAGKGVRRCFLSRYPYQIIYRIDDEVIEIIAVAHLKRRPGYWRKRLPK